jgi:hypothetical protein
LTHLADLPRDERFPAARRPEEQHAAHVVNAQLLHDLL